MLTILIAEDERHTRECLVKFTPWDTLGIEEILTAKDGREALELFDGKSPDLVLTDIRMPRVDGISLVREIRKRKKRCQVVFLSGHTDKEYLLSAIDLKAVSYVEKPVDYDQLAEVLTKAIALYRQDTLHANNARLALDSIMDRLSRGGKWTSGERELFESAYPTLFNSQSYALFYVMFQSESIRPALSNVLWEIQPEREFIGGISMEGHSDYEVVRSELKGLCDKMGAFVYLSLPETGGAKAFPPLFAQMGQGQEIFYFHGPGELIMVRLDMAPPYAPPDNWQADLSMFLEGDSPERTIYFIEKICRGFSRGPAIRGPLSGAEECRRWLDDAGRLIGKRQKALPGLPSDVCHSLPPSPGKKETLDAGRGELCRIAREFHRRREELSGKDLTVLRCLDLIEEEFFRKDLTLDDMGSRLGVTKEHLCKIFKQERKETVNTRLTERRLDEARRLLRESSLRIYEIADRVGYADKDYFTRLFKRKTGKTPRRYRENP